MLENSGQLDNTWITGHLWSWCEAQTRVPFKHKGSWNCHILNPFLSIIASFFMKSKHTCIKLWARLWKSRVTVWTLGHFAPSCITISFSLWIYINNNWCGNVVAVTLLWLKLYPWKSCLNKKLCALVYNMSSIYTDCCRVVLLLYGTPQNVLSLERCCVDWLGQNQKEEEERGITESNKFCWNFFLFFVRFRFRYLHI